MTPEQYRALREAFHEAESMAPEARAAHLERCCAGDEEMLATARSMLHIESRTGTGTGDPSGGLLGDSVRASAVPERIAEFHIVSELGAGGVGTVYEAEQQSPKRSVALKVMRRSNPSERLARRFELESEILGRLTHPGIAQVYASGIAQTPDGPRHYIAMELVPGEPISRWARRESVTLRDRLDAFVRVCDAVHYAHQRGVIHRDLKPANIFIDDLGQPKVLDFGIARALDDGGTSVPMGTLQGEILGTLDYMSPEQAQGDLETIDVRTDVYALGAVLFELVSGETPIDTSGLALAAALDAVRSPTRRTLRHSGTSVSSDLDIVVSTALDPERDRRYASVQALREDVQRVLANEPILARAPSMSYQLLKFAQRRRAAVVAMLAVGLTLVGATAFSLRSATIASDAREIAERERTEAQQTLTLLTDAMVAANPNVRGTAEYTVREFLSDVATTLDDEESAPSPDAEAQLRTAIGDAFIGLGRPDLALKEFERAHAIRSETLGDVHEETLRVEMLRCVALLDVGDTQEGRSGLTALVPKAVRALGRTHTTTVDSIYYLASAHAKANEPDLAEPLYRDLLETYLERYGEEHEETVATMSSLAQVLQNMGRLEDALPLAERSAELDARLNGPEHPYTLTTLNNLGMLYARTERYDDAERIFRNVYDARVRTMPAEHRHIGVSMASLGSLYRMLERFDESERWTLDAYEHFVTHQGEDHPYTRIALGQCVMLYEAWQREDEAEQWRSMRGTEDAANAPASP